MNTQMQGGLWLTSGGRIVLDNHSGEIFSVPADRKLLTKEELTNGVKFKKFICILLELDR